MDNELIKTLIDKGISWPGVWIIGIVCFTLLCFFCDPIRKLLNRFKSAKWPGGGVYTHYKEVNGDSITSTERSTKKSNLEKDKIEENSEEPLEFPARLYIEGTKSKEDDENIRNTIKLAEEWKKSKGPEETDESIERVKYMILRFNNYYNYENELLELNDTKDWFFTAEYLAEFYLKLDSYDRAEQQLSTMTERGKTADEKMKCILVKTDILSKSKNTDEAIKYLEEKMKCASDLPDVNNKVHLLEKLSELYEKKGNFVKKKLILEEALKLDPSNKKLRFDLAYSYGNKDDEKLLSFYHYEKLLAIDPRNDLAMNNLAIVCKQLNLTSKKDELLNKSAKDIGIALGNLIIDYVQAGFFNQAKHLIDKMPHSLLNDPRVIEAKEYLTRELQLDSEKESNIKKNSDDLHKFINEALDNHNNVDPKEITGEWKSTGFTLNIELRKDQIVGELKVTSSSQIASLFSITANDDIYTISGYFEQNILCLHAQFNQNKSPQKQLIDQLMISGKKFKLMLIDNLTLRGVIFCDNFSSMASIEFIKI